jgi:hypothetical protein
MSDDYGMKNDGHIEAQRKKEIREARLAAEAKKAEEEKAAAANAENEESAGLESAEGEQVDEDEFEKQETGDTSPINADFEVESSEDAEGDDYDEDPDNEYADFNYAGQKAKEEREIRKSRRWVWVFLISAAIVACIGLITL